MTAEPNRPSGPRASIVRAASLAIPLLAVAPFAAYAQTGPAPITSCDMGGIGAAVLTSDLPTLPTTTPPNDTSVTITSATTGTTGGVPYCLVKLVVKPAINIWVGLPTGGRWNGRLQSEGGGGYAGSVGIPTGSIAGGYVGVQTDTGHAGATGNFGMLTPVPDGAPDVQLQTDFANRSEHLMAVLGKQLAQAFYGQQPQYAYWNGCSTGGRQGMRMAQDFPGDYNGILAGAPAMHWDRFQAEQIWPEVAMRVDAGHVVSNAKQALATSKAIAACDALGDGVVDGVIGDPRLCTYNPVNDASITKASCASTDNTCLAPGEASAMQKIWNGATNAKGKRLWYGQERGADTTALAGATPFFIATQQPQYWVYFDPTWDWRTLDYGNFETFFKQTMQMVGPRMSSENPDLSAYRDRGGKIVMWQGWADQLIMPQGSTSYYDAVANVMGGYSALSPWYRHFMAPGVAHCGGGNGPQPQNLFQSVVDWVEKGTAPDTILASKPVTGGTQTRPLCPYPAVAKYTGSGDLNSAANFVCAQP